MRDESNNRRFYAINYKDDIPNEGKGLLIPAFKKSSRKKLWLQSLSPFLLPTLALVFLLGAGTFGAQAVSSVNTASVPKISFFNPNTSQIEPFHYGVQMAFTSPSFFTETREAFIEAELTFLEADLVDMIMRYFEDGVLVENVPIKSKASAGSWCQAPAGIYQVENKREKYFSTVGQVYQPWSISFQSNFFIHGWSKYANNQPVTEDFSGDCIRLEDGDAERIFKHIKVRTPVIVYEKELKSEPFLYEPRIPELKTPHYLIADIESNTVLASSRLDAVASIASVTKLMTALIAAENISLDKNVWVNQPTFVNSLVPRLSDRNQASMYSLLQLLLIESSNEAAEIIALELGRSEFMRLMNDKAASLGMVDTYFIDPSGLGAENTSSVGDLLRLTKYIHQNRSFIFDLTANQNLTTSYINNEFGSLNNFNEIKGENNFMGGKVGETRAAGQTSVSLHKLTVKGLERTLVIIILGSENRDADVTELLHYARERFSS